MREVSEVVAPWKLEVVNIPTSSQAIFDRCFAFRMTRKLAFSAAFERVGRDCIFTKLHI